MYGKGRRVKQREAATETLMVQSGLPSHLHSVCTVHFHIIQYHRTMHTHIQYVHICTYIYTHCCGLSDNTYIQLSTGIYPSLIMHVHSGLTRACTCASWERMLKHFHCDSAFFMGASVLPHSLSLNLFYCPMICTVACNYSMSHAPCWMLTDWRITRTTGSLPWLMRWDTRELKGNTRIISRTK